MGDDANLHAPSIPWADIRGLGNIIRHEYGDIDYQTLWELRENDLPELRRACEDALARMKP